MSTKKVNSKERDQRTNQKPTEVKLHPDLMTKITVAKDSVVGEYGLINFHTMQPIPIAGMVVSHPIGVTDFADNQFVLNRVKDVPVLKSRVADPSSARLREKKEELKKQFLLEDKILEQREGKYYFTLSTELPGRVYEEAYKDAQARRLAAQEEHKERVSKMKLRKGQKPPLFNQTVFDFLSEEEYGLKIRIESCLLERKYEEECKKRFPTEHRTLLDDEKPQNLVNIPGVSLHGLTLTQAMDKIQSETWKFLTGKSDVSKDAVVVALKKENNELLLKVQKQGLDHKIELKNLENRDEALRMKNREIEKLQSQLKEALERVSFLEQQNEEEEEVAKL